MSRIVLEVDVTGNPVALVDWFSALCSVYTGRASVISQLDDEFWCSPSQKIPKPLIVQKVGRHKFRPRAGKWLTRASIWIRDNHECQYCGTKLTPNNRSLDHVVPKSRYREVGMTRKQCFSSSNCVSCCKPCNTAKGNKLPAEWGKLPKENRSAPDHAAVLYSQAAHEQQRDYLRAFIH